MVLTVIVFLVILSVLVLIHEAGHFFMAKFFGIKVEEFGFGLPPRAFGKKFGETIYSINWLPIGGFVKLYGEDEAGSGRVSVSSSNSSKKASKEPKAKNKDLERAFYSRPVWQRAVVVCAGVFMNFVLAVVLLSYLFAAVGVPAGGNKVIVTQVVSGTPAQSSGLKTGDTIEYINNIKITSPGQIVDVTKQHLGEKITLRVETKDNKQETLEIVPRKNYPSNEGPMGVAISQNVIIQKYPWYKAPFVGISEAFTEMGLILSGLGMLVFQLFARGSVPQGVAGPVGIAELTGQFVAMGPYAVLSFVSLLSLNLAILNILPIPALDGGRLFFILIEGITRRKVNQQVESYAHAIGMAVLLILIALITLHDIIRIVTGQPLIPQLK